MDPKQFEKNIHDKLSRHKSSLNTDALWGDIQANMTPKRKKRPFLWALPLVCILGAVFIFYKPQNQGNSTYVEKDIKEKSYIESKENNPLIPVESIVSNENTIGDGAVSTKLLIQKKDKTAERNYTDRLSRNSNPIVKVEVEPSPVFENEKEELLFSEVLAKEELLLNKTSEAPNEYMVDLISTPIVLLDIPQKNPLLFYPENLISQNKKPKKWTVFAGVFTGIGFANRDLSTTASDLGDYISTKETTEKSKVTYQVGGEISFVHQPTHLFLKTGLYYTQINEEFQHTSTTDLQRWDENGISELIINELSNETIEVREGNWETDRTHRVVRHNNTYKLLDVPVLVGYQFKKHPNWHFNIETGLAANVLFKSSGKTINPDEQITTFAENTAINYKSTGGLSWLSGFDIGYQINPAMQIQIGCKYRHPLSSLTKSESNVGQKYSILGINLGVRKMLIR